ncbi:cytochrome c-type biogenesis protein CcmH [Salinispirillum marinum]|uniref:Cytochrome c-type biogenesis protein n=2 Tax=Saccharospirillaceae TaxID=255527 RepID=A0ABV8BHI0_9GAMM
MMPPRPAVKRRLSLASLIFLSLCFSFIAASYSAAQARSEIAASPSESAFIRDFSDPSYEARYFTLTHELRCPRCQNQSIADSDAPIALDMRQRTVQLLEAGYTDEEIVDFMIERWGDFVTYRPRFGAHMVWIFALIALTVVGLLMAVWAVRRVHSPASSPEQELSPEQQQARINELRQQVNKS